MGDPAVAQIAALQHIVRIQDDMLRGDKKSPEVTKMWRNEAYKATVQKRIVEEETVRLGRELIGQLNNQRSAIGATIGREFGRAIRAFEESASKSIQTIDKRLRRLEANVANLRQVFHMHKSHRESVEELRIRNDTLAGENAALRAEVERMKERIATSEYDNTRTIRELTEGLATMQRRPSFDVRAEKLKPNVQEVLREIKELEREAQRLLIKE